MIGNPTISTNSTTNISYTTATLNGFLNSDGSLDCNVWFEWGETTSYGNTSYIAPNWTENTTMDFDVDVGYRSTPCIFNMSGTYYAIIGENDGVFTGMRWDGNTWVSDSSIANGLSDVGLRSTPTVFELDSTYYLLSGEYSDNINGYHWDGSQWQTNTTIDDGFSFGGGSEYGPHAFWMNGNLYCLVGDSAGNVQGYKWNGNSWDSYNAIESGIGFADTGRPTVYQKDISYYLIIGQYNGQFNGYKWTGSTWETNNTIISGLSDTGTRSSPDVFEINNIYYLITGKNDGTFDGYHWNETTYNTGEHINQDISSLTPDTTYHFRAVSENAVGRTNGSDKTFTTSNSVSINTTTSVASTSIQANGYIHYGAPTAGFWIHTESNISATNFTINKTADVSGSNIYKTITSSDGLQAGQYYYIKAWQSHDGFRNSTSTSHFMTKPQSPSSVSSTVNPTNITLSWTNGTHRVSNHRTIIRYSTSSYPSTINDGTGVNTTGNSYTFTSLDYNQDYYFSLWSYINASGSPTFHAYSPSETTYSDATVGGAFNLTIRYENTTHQPVNLSNGYFHELIVHFTNATRHLYFDDQGEINDTTSTLSYLFNDTENGTIEFQSPSFIREIEFYWNYSSSTDFSEQSTYDTTSITDPTANNWISLTNTPNDESAIEVSYINQSNFGDYHYTISDSNWTYHSNNDTINVNDDDFAQEANTLRVYYTFSPTTPYRCHRIIIPENQSSGDIYILTNKEIYSETTGDYTKQNRLIPYNYYFMDMTGDYSQTDDNAYCVVYIKDTDGNNLIIHSEYLLKGGMLYAYPQLLYNKNYYLSVFSDTRSTQLGTAPTGNTLEPQLPISSSEETVGGTSTYYTYNDIITDSYYRTDTKIQYNYSDGTVGATDNVSFTIYYLSNGTLIDSSVEYAESNSHQYKFFDVDGYNASEDYYLLVRTIIEPDSLSEYNEYNGTYYKLIHFYADKNYSKTSSSWIDTLFTNLFGDSPLYRTDDGHTDDYVPWSYIFMFIIAFFTMVTFSRKNGFIGMLATGLVIILMSVIVSGLNVLYSGSVGGAIITSVVGGLMVAVGVVGIIGGIDTR